MVLQIFTDGASRGNPGDAGAGVVIFKDGEEIKRIEKYLGKKTNNEAEYGAVVEALKYVTQNNLSGENILLFSDSEFLTKQLKGEYAVKSPKIKPLFEEVDKLRKNLKFNVNWVPREDNKIADSIANEAIDNNKFNKNQQTVDNSILLLDKAFFGKINCLKIQLNNDFDCYFHLGLDTKGEWSWIKVKMSINELGDIIHLLRQEIAKCSFFHSFGDNKTQIWCNKSEKGFSIKIDKISKNLSIGESEVLRVILEEIIKRVEFK